MSASGTGKRVILSHGDGGSLTRDLIREVFLPALGGAELGEMDDAALVGVLAEAGTSAGRPASLLYTTDSFVVDPPFFPGGDIGKLSVFGTLNDLWVSGARPLALSAGFIIEEGTLFQDLRRIADSMALAASTAGVRVVTADTKVVPKGKGDKVFINTSGIGVLTGGRRMPRKALPGDRVAVSGTIGEHGLVILATRLGLPLGDLMSDCGPVGPAIDRLFDSGVQVHMMRDPTRGGLASVLKEVAEKSAVTVRVREADVPVLPEAGDLADILGIDPMYLPCEGRVVAFVGPGTLPSGWTEIGEVVPGQGEVLLETRYGGTRRLTLFEGTPLPRIC